MAALLDAAPTLKSLTYCARARYRQLDPKSLHVKRNCLKASGDAWGLHLFALLLATPTKQPRGNTEGTEMFHEACNSQGAYTDPTKASVLDSFTIKYEPMAHNSFKGCI